MRMRMVRRVVRSLLILSALPGIAIGESEDASRPALEEVVVTAFKRAQSLEDVPVSVVFISEDRIEKSGFERITDLQYSTPGFVQTGQDNGGWIQLTLRGISTPTVSTGFSNGIGMFIDGVEQGEPYAFNQELIDIEKIEVLRGPQGTLFGKNTIAGAFVVTTKKPNLEEMEGKLNVEYGRFDALNLKGTVSVPIMENQLAMKLSAYRKTDDGYTKNVFTGGRVNNRNEVGGRFQVRFAPTDSFTADVSVDYLRERRHYAYHEIIADTPGGPDFTVPGNMPPGLNTIAHTFDDSEDRDLWGIQVNAEYELDNGFTFSSVSGYRGGRDDIVDDSDHAPADLFRYIQFKKYTQASQEFRVASPTAEEWGEKYDYVVGLYSQVLDSSQRNGWRWGVDNGNSPGAVAGTESFAPANLVAVQAAVFGQANYYINDRLFINAGLRYNWERKDMDFSEDGFVGGLPATPFFEDHLTDSGFSPMASLNYYLTEDILTYFKYSRGFKSGAFNLGVFKGCTANCDFSFSEELVDSFELGVKGSAFDRRVTYGLAGYYMDYSSLQVEVLIPPEGPGLPPTRAPGAAKADIYGVEMETVIKPTGWLTIDGGFSYSSAKFKDSVPGFGGNHLPNAPELTAYVNGTIELPIGDIGLGYLRGEFTSRSKWYSFATNNSFERPDGYKLFNASAGLDTNFGWGISAWVKNLSDKEYCTELWDISGGLRCGFHVPRTYGVSATYEF